MRGFWVQALNHGGDGTFTYTLGNWDSSWTVVPSDLDGDGLTDMFVYNFATGVWVKCFVDGSGGFKGYTVGQLGSGLDVLHRGPERRRRATTSSSTTGRTASGSRRSVRRASATFDYPASGQWDPGWQVYPADLNGDGRTDLFLLNAAGVHVSAR